MKICVKCRSSKDLNEFHKDNRRPDGHFPYCKKCRLIPRKPSVSRPIDVVLSDYKISDMGCWEWQGVLTRDGYGMACYKGKRIRAHRLSLLQSLNLSDSNLLALHRCDNRKCINPDHLYLGTPLRNSGDMVERCRSSRLLGDKNPVRVINSTVALEIFKDQNPHKEIASKYGISQSAVSAIKCGKNWSHLTGKDYQPKPRNKALAKAS